MKKLADIGITDSWSDYRYISTKYITNRLQLKVATYRANTLYVAKMQKQKFVSTKLLFADYLFVQTYSWTIDFHSFEAWSTLSASSYTYKCP